MNHKMTMTEVLANLQVDVFAGNKSLELYQGFSDCPTMDDINNLLDLFKVCDYDYSAKDGQL